MLTTDGYSYIITVVSRGYNFERQENIVTWCGSAWLERLVWDQEVAGSNPVTPISMRV